MTAADVVLLDRRFCGPPNSGNGGYTCGVAASPVGESAVVRLRLPPPLATPLHRRIDGEVHELVDDAGDVVATARPLDAELDVMAFPGADAVAAAVAAFDLDEYAASHPFDRCFTCGPAREPDDGLRIFPAALGSSATVVWRWTPSARDEASDGLVNPAVMWAALDCPSGQAWMRHPTDPSGPVVLGELAARIFERARPGESTVVAGWPVRSEGRRRVAGSAVWASDGRLLAVGAATWIVLSEEQLGGFGARP